jgi:hypothetical protein
MKDYTELANQYAKENGYSEPDWLRKQCVGIFLDAVKVGYEDGLAENRESVKSEDN